MDETRKNLALAYYKLMVHAKRIWKESVYCFETSLIKSNYSLPMIFIIFYELFTNYFSKVDGAL